MSGGDTWQATMALNLAVEYLIQAVDLAGKVAVDDNATRYYRADASPLDVLTSDPASESVIVSIRKQSETEQQDNRLDSK